MKYIIMACAVLQSFSLYSMDDWDSGYDHQAIGKTSDFIKKVNNVYNPAPTQTEGPFDQAQVLNTPYLQEILKASQEKKDEASERMSAFQFYDGSREWALKRTYLAAAALCGGKKGLDRCLESATRAQDFHLCQLLLEHGAKPGKLLTHVQTVKLAELFLAHNASVAKYNSAFDFGLLHNVAFSNSYESGLIPLYRKHGLSPLGKDNPLFSLLYSIDTLPWPHLNEEELLKKARFLLTDLSPEDTINLLLRYPDPFRGHILTRLKHECLPAASTENKFIKENLYKILLQAKIDAEQKLGKRGTDFGYSKYTDLIGRPPRKEKTVIILKQVNP